MRQQGEGYGDMHGPEQAAVAPFFQQRRNGPFAVTEKGFHDVIQPGAVARTFDIHQLDNRRIGSERFKEIDAGGVKPLIQSGRFRKARLQCHHAVVQAVHALFDRGRPKPLFGSEPGIEQTMAYATGGCYLAERSAFAERVSTAYERGETISIDIAQDPHNLAMFTRYAEQYGGNSASARVLMEAELARQSLRPHSVFSDGTAVPMAFGDLQAQHLRNSGDPALAPDLTGRHQSNQGDVRRFGGGATPPTPTAGSASSMRSTVREEGKRIRATTSADQGTFDRKAQITRTPDGTLASERSLMMQTGKQVKEDAAPLIDEAKEAVKKALKK